MQPIRIVAIPTAVAEAVRETLRAPVYGFPAHAEVATDAAPCRHCLRPIDPGQARRILFTYDRFTGLEPLPQPGPIYIHADNCPRYPEDGGFPEELRGSPRTLEAYARGRRLVAQEYITNGEFEPVIEKLFAHADINYLQVNSTTAGCFTFRIERPERPMTDQSETRDAHIGTARSTRPLLTRNQPFALPFGLEGGELCSYRPVPSSGLSRWSGSTRDSPAILSPNEQTCLCRNS